MYLGKCLCGEVQVKISGEITGAVDLSYTPLLEPIFFSSNEKDTRIVYLFKSLLKQLEKKIGPALRVESEIPPLFVANGLI
jgi:hypothetical protein